MDTSHIFALITVLIIFPVGQLLFKLAANSTNFEKGIHEAITSGFNGYFVSALFKV